MKKILSPVKIVYFLATFNIILIILGFTVPKTSLIIWAIIILFMALIIFCAGKWFSTRLEVIAERLYREYKPISSDTPEENDTVNKKNVAVFVAIVIVGMLCLVFNEWRRKSLFLSILGITTPIIVLCLPLLGENTAFFLHVVTLYFFCRLFIHFALDQKMSQKPEKFLAGLKMALEGLRVFIIFIGILIKDHCLGFETQRPLLEAVVATIAIDSIMKEYSEKFSKKNASVE